MGDGPVSRTSISNVDEAVFAEVELSSASLPSILTAAADSEIGGLETLSQRLERLGRQRPDVFPNAWAEVGFCFAVVMSQILAEYFISGFDVILPTLIKDLDIPTASAVWPSSAFSLTVASTLLVFGRGADMLGGYVVYIFGLTWLVMWSIICGFSKSEVMLDVCRALQGFGPAAFLPSSMMLIGRVYRPGPRKNLVFSIYGACSVVGVFVGILSAGIFGTFIHWSWYFWIGAILAAITAVVAYFTIPCDFGQQDRQDIKMDWLGAALIVTALNALTFSITDSSNAPWGWKTPYIFGNLILGTILLLLALYVEARIAKCPLLPLDIFTIKHMKPLFLALLLMYGGLGIFLLYGTLYMINIMGATPLQVVAWTSPMIVGGITISIVGGFVFHVVSGTLLLLISGFGWIASGILFATAPASANYWATVFPAMACATIGVDIAFCVTNIFITTAMPSHRQGLAGALINSLMHLGISILLGFADIVQSMTNRAGGDLRKSYQYAFWFLVATSCTSVVIMTFFVKIDAATSDLTADEKRRVAARAKSNSTSTEEQTRVEDGISETDPAASSEL